MVQLYFTSESNRIIVDVCHVWRVHSCVACSLMCLLQIVLEPKGSDERVVVTSPWATYLLRDDDNVKWKFWHPPRGQVCLVFILRAAL